MTQQSGPADRQAEEIVQQVARLAERDAQVGAAVTGEQPCPWPEVSAGQFQIAASLAGLLAVSATMNVPAIAMPLELGLGNVGDDVVFELSGGFEFAAAAMRALLGMHVVFDERGFRRRLGPKHAGVLAMFLSPAVVGRARAGLGLLLGPLATLEKCLKLVFELRNPPPQLGVLRLKLRNPSITRVVHARQVCPKTRFDGRAVA